MSRSNPNQPAPSYSDEEKLQYLSYFGYLNEREARMIEIALKLKTDSHCESKVKIATDHGEISCTIEFRKRMEDA